MAGAADETLRTHVLGCLEASLALATEGLNPDDMPLRESVRITTDGETARSEPQFMPDVGLVLIRKFSSLQALPEVETLREYLLGSPIGDPVFVDAANNPIEDKSTQSHWLTNFYVIPMLLEYIGSDQMLEFDRQERLRGEGSGEKPGDK